MTMTNYIDVTIEVYGRVIVDWHFYFQGVTVPQNAEPERNRGVKC